MDCTLCVRDDSKVSRERPSALDLRRAHRGMPVPCPLSAHRPVVQDTVREYLNIRYKLAPSLIAAGHLAAETAWPIAVRADLVWPDTHLEQAASNTQYLWLNDTLVAPALCDPACSTNTTKRDVYFPPGSWQDVWNGTIVQGPTTLGVEQPFERQPMWHRRGGLIVSASTAALQIEKQDWSHLTIEAFPDFELDQPGILCSSSEIRNFSVVSRLVVSQSTAAAAAASRTHISMMTSSNGTLRFDIGRDSEGLARAWTLRVHLLPSQRVQAVNASGRMFYDATIQQSHLVPVDALAAKDFFPFGGKHSRPAMFAGHVFQVELPLQARQQQVHLVVR